MLVFDVQGQQIIQRGDTYVAASSVNYLEAQFSFSDDWDDELTRTAVFYDASREHAYNQILDSDGKCVVPWEVIQAPYFFVSVYSGAADEETHATTLLITTNELKISVARSGYRLGDTTTPPSADVYVQLTALIDEVSALLDEDITDVNEDVSALDTRLDTAEAKLLTIESGAEANVQANWNENNITSDAFIKNKPSIGVLSSLTTSDKSSIVAAINEVNADLTSEASTRANADTSLGNGITAAFTAIGTLSNLNTTAKTNLVAAVNEVDGRCDVNAGAIGTLSSLTTTAKSSLVAAVNELDAGKADTGDIVTYAISGSGNTVTLTGSDGSTSSATVSGGGGEYTAGAGIDITSDVISVDTGGVTWAMMSSTAKERIDTGGISTTTVTMSAYSVSGDTVTITCDVTPSQSQTAYYTFIDNCDIIDYFNVGAGSVYTSVTVGGVDLVSGVLRTNEAGGVTLELLLTALCSGDTLLHYSSGGWLTVNDTLLERVAAVEGKTGADKVGDLSTLTTTAKTNAVAAINEINAAVGTADAVLAQLLTTGV